MKYAKENIIDSSEEGSDENQESSESSDYSSVLKDGDSIEFQMQDF